MKGRAIEFLVLADNFDPVSLMTKTINEASNNIERLALLNIASYLHEVTGVVFPMPVKDTRVKAVKGSATYNSDRYMYTWLSRRWEYISGVAIKD